MTRARRPPPPCRRRPRPRRARPRRKPIPRRPQANPERSRRSRDCRHRHAMPENPKPSLLRFCGSCLITVTCWAVWLVLGVTLAALLHVAIAHELPVPDFVLRRAEAKLAEAGLTIKFGRARFDPTGKLLLEDVQFRSRQ